MLYTVGHSIQPIEDFYDMLRKFSINCVLDVRSTPYSQRAPQFNKETLQLYLYNKGVLYVPFGKEFGARRDDCYVPIIDKGQEIMQVNFENGVKTENFIRGIQRLNKALSQKRTIALMCAEANPLDCHRFSFISRFLYDNKYEICHIVREKKSHEILLKTHEDLEHIMIAEYVRKKKLLELGDLFNDYSPEQQRNDAYRLKNREIGYILSQEYSEYLSA